MRLSVWGAERRAVRARQRAFQRPAAGRPGRSDEHDAHTTLNEGYAYWRDALGVGWGVQVGRQDFDERREWLYDQNPTRCA